MILPTISINAHLCLLPFVAWKETSLNLVLLVILIRGRQRWWPVRVGIHMANSAGAAAEGLLRCVYEGCIAGCDTGIERRPYHRNCGCALHDKSRKGSPNAAFSKCCKKNVSYPIRRSWSEGSLLLHAASNSSNHSSPSSSPAHVVGAAAGKPANSHHQSSLCDRNEDQDEYVLFKI